MFRFGSLASGIEAASVAWKPLGMTPAFFSEIDSFCCSLLSQRHPDAPNLGDMNDITTHALRRCGPIDCLVFGTPCQAWSVAGERGGLEDPRGQLTLRAVQLLEYLRPRWFVWENVPGVLSANSGRDLGCVLNEVAKLGYGWAYRILDAQYFGVPQRRRRIFLVGHLGSWSSAAAVLFEPGCVPRNSAKGGKAKQDTSGTITSGSGRRRGAGVNPSEIVAALTACGVGTCGVDDNQSQAGHLVPALTTNRYADRESEEGKLIVTHTLRGEGFDASEDGIGRGTPLVPIYAIQERAVSENVSNGPAGKGWQERIAYTLEARHHVQAVAMAFTQNQRDEVRYIGGDGQTVGALAAEPGMKQQTYLQVRSSVRRLTPRECERLQGFPDDYTLITHRKKPSADGPRYKAIGNSIAIPVLRWIGKRILLIDQSN